MRTLKNLDNETFIEEYELGFSDLRIIRDALQLKVNEELTSPEPDITSRLNAIRQTAEAIGIDENINWSADAVDQ